MRHQFHIYPELSFKEYETSKLVVDELEKLGVEILNPTEDYTTYLKTIAEEIISMRTSEFETKLDVTRGLDYYEKGKGFEIEIPSLGAQKQACGGGKYANGIGFAIGIDRLLLI